MSKKDSRPEGYQYIKIIRDHLDGDDKTIFNGKLKYPRQMEVHLPGNRLIPCNFECFYCQGKIVNQALGQWEEKGLNLIEKLKGSIPYYIYGGAYVEPLLNKYLLDYLKLTKKYGNNFGIHTNGSLLLELEEEKEFCSTLVKLADSKLDYISISLDAGSTDSHCKTKNIKDDWFSKIIEGVRLLVKLRGRKKYPVIRVCYLMNKYKEHIKKTIKPQFPNIHRDRLIEHLEALDNFNKITSTAEYINQIEEINSSLKKIYPKKAIKANLKQGLMIGMIMNMPKKQILPRLRNQVWRKHNHNTLIGECTICKKSIDRDNDIWHCSHIKSEFNGGYTALENLIPCCPDCNLQMGIQDANKYCMAKFKREIPLYNLIPGSPV